MRGPGAFDPGSLMSSFQDEQYVPGDVALSRSRHLPLGCTSGWYAANGGWLLCGVAQGVARLKSSHREGT